MVLLSEASHNLRWRLHLELNFFPLCVQYSRVEWFAFCTDLSFAYHQCLTVLRWCSSWIHKCCFIIIDAAQGLSAFTSSIMTYFPMRRRNEQQNVKPQFLAKQSYKVCGFSKAHKNLNQFLTKLKLAICLWMLFNFHIWMVGREPKPFSASPPISHCIGIESVQNCDYFSWSYQFLSFISVWKRSWRGHARQTEATRCTCCSVLTKTTKKP